MYLKVKDGSAWSIFECIMLRHYTTTISPSEIAWADDLIFHGNKQQDERIPSVVATIRTKDGKGYVVVFNTTGYLCSDEGNTIEVLRPKEE